MHFRVWLSRSQVVSVEGRIYPYVFQFWHCQLSFKKQWGEVGVLIFIFVVWGSLIISGWVMVAWSRKYYLGQLKLRLLCSLFYSRMVWSPRPQISVLNCCVLFFALLWIKGMRNCNEFRILLHHHSVGKIPLQFFVSC